MWIRFWNAFTKITGWPIQKLAFRTKIHCEDAAVQNRRIRGSAIIVSNHTSVFDYAVFMFVFFSRTLRYQMAELLFEKKPLGLLLKLLGGIRVDRNSQNFSFLSVSERILEKGGVVGIFPESRLPLPDEEAPLPFKPSAAYLALTSGVPVIPVYTNGSYFSKKRAAVMIGKPFEARTLTDDSLSEKENIDFVARAMRQRVIDLGNLLHERNEETKKK